MKDEKAVSAIVDNLTRIFHAVEDYSRTTVLSTGLTGPQLWALKILANGTPMRVSGLARQMCLSPATVVGILDRLEGKGLVTRTRSREDRRVVDLHLTGVGQELAATTPEVAQVLLVNRLEQLTEEQFFCVGEGMKLMVDLLGAKWPALSRST